MKKVISILLKFTSAVMLIGGTVLGFLATKKMGVQRSLYYRNLKLEESVLSTQGMIALVLVAGLYFWLVWKDKERLTQVELSVFRVGAGFLVLTVAFYIMSSFMGAPWIMLGAYLYFMAVCFETIQSK